MSKIFKHEPLPKNLSVDFLNEIYVSHEKMTLEEVTKSKGKYQDILLDMEVILTKELRDIIIDFLNSKERIKVYGVGEWKRVSDFLGKVTSKKTKELILEDIVVLRAIVQDSKLTTIDAINSVGVPIVDALEDVNMEITNLNEIIGIIAQVEARKDKEALTGMEFAEGDSENQQKLMGISK